MAITIKDVAKETNLAISTISKYINGGNVREKNRRPKLSDRYGRKPVIPATRLASRSNFFLLIFKTSHPDNTATIMDSSAGAVISI